MSIKNITTTPVAPQIGPPVCDDVPGYVSKETAKKLSDFSLEYKNIHGYLAAALCVLGMFASSSAIVVLTRKHMTFTGSTLLTWLAVVELVRMTLYLPLAVFTFIAQAPHRADLPFSVKTEFWGFYNLYFGTFGILICHNSSIWITITLAIFRCIFIWFPRKAAVVCSPLRSHIAAGLVILASVLICTPIILCYESRKIKIPLPLSDASTQDSTHNPNQPGVNPVNDSATAATIPTQTPITFYETYASVPNGKYEKLKKINMFIHFFILKIVPSSLLTILTALLLVAMNRAYRFRRTLMSQDSVLAPQIRNDERRTTRMMVAVVSVFTFTETFHAILIILTITIHCFEAAIYHKIGDLLDLLVLFTSNVCFILYVTMNRSFRRTFVQLFCPDVVLRNKPAWLMINTTTRPTSYATKHSGSLPHEIRHSQHHSSTKDELFLEASTSAGTCRMSELESDVDKLSEVRSHGVGASRKSFKAGSERKMQGGRVRVNTIVSEDVKYNADSRGVRLSHFHRVSADSTSV